MCGGILGDGMFSCLSIGLVTYIGSRAQRSSSKPTPIALPSYLRSRGVNLNHGIWTWTVAWLSLRIGSLRYLDMMFKQHHNRLRVHNVLGIVKRPSRSDAHRALRWLQQHSNRVSIMNVPHKEARDV